MEKKSMSEEECQIMIQKSFRSKSNFLLHFLLYLSPIDDLTYFYRVLGFRVLSYLCVFMLIGLGFMATFFDSSNGEVFEGTFGKSWVCSRRQFFQSYYLQPESGWLLCSRWRGTCFLVHLLLLFVPFIQVNCNCGLNGNFVC